MGYVIVLMPVEVGGSRSAAKAVYARWPQAAVGSTVGSESMLSALIRRWPTIAERPSRSVGASVTIDHAAPFDIDIDGGLIVLDVSWDSLTRVLPDVQALASAAGVSMYLPYEGPIVRPREFEGRLLRPGDGTDMRDAWAAREETESRAIDQMVEDAHVGMSTHGDHDKY